MANAHEDVFTPFGGHVPVSFEKAEKEAAGAFTKAKDWSVEYDGEDLRNFLQKPPNNGFATIIAKL